MHDYDVTLKLLLRGPAQETMRELTGVSIGKWLNIELPKFQNPRVDLLGEGSDQSIVHLELQSTNDPRMAIRMAEYALGVYRLFGKFPRQILVYVGEAQLRMQTELAGPRLWFQFDAIDIRDLDGERLLASEQVGDNVIAILTRLRDRKSAVHEIIEKLSGVQAEPKEYYLRALLTLAGLRGLEELVEEEARKVPVLNDILEHKVLGREFKKGMAQGVKEGMQQEALTVLRRLIEKRFGSLPDWAGERLAERNATELEDLSVRVLDAKSVEDLLK